jgi:predicted transcriptional regulator
MGVSLLLSRLLPLILEAPLILVLHLRAGSSQPQIAVLNQGAIDGNRIEMRTAMMEAVDGCTRTDFKVVGAVVCRVVVKVMHYLTAF